MIISFIVTIILVLACILIHYEALRLVSKRFERAQFTPRSGVLLVLAAATCAHMLEIAVFAGASAALVGFGIGGIDGVIAQDWMDWVYLSASSYTTLGMGDILPVGPLRLLVAVESLIGLVMIGWTTSFTYLVMRDSWKLHK